MPEKSMTLVCTNKYLEFIYSIMYNVIVSDGSAPYW